MRKMERENILLFFRFAPSFFPGSFLVSDFSLFNSRYFLYSSPFGCTGILKEGRNV
jgi:hypothetical protein